MIGLHMNMKRYSYHSPDADPDKSLLDEEPVHKKHRKAHDGHDKPRRKWLRRTLKTFAVLLVLLILAVGWVGWLFFQDSTKVFGGTVIGNATKTFRPTNLKTDDHGRTNILLAGNSTDDPEHAGADLTDSIMVISVNPDTKKSYVLSIPRDLWVEIPDYGYQKINSAYHWGEEDKFNKAGYPPGGIGLLSTIIEDTFGLSLQYYGLVNYAALRGSVNAVDGIDVTIKSTDPRGLYDPNIQATEGGPLKLTNGPHHLDGQTALNLARARGAPAPDGRISYGFGTGDFVRTENQRQVLAALRSKVLSSEVLFNPFRLNKVFDALSNNLKTNLEINEARRLVTLLQGIPAHDFKSANLYEKEKPLLRGYTTSNGQSALIPTEGIDDYSTIRKYLITLQ